MDRRNYEMRNVLYVVYIGGDTLYIKRTLGDAYVFVAETCRCAVGQIPEGVIIAEYKFSKRF